MYATDAKRLEVKWREALPTRHIAMLLDKIAAAGAERGAVDIYHVENNS